MGACSFTTSSYGKSMSDAYSNAVEDATSEYGTDAYNGTISTTQGCKDVTAEYKRSGKSLNQFINDNIEKCQKWGSAWGVCVEEPITNKGKIKSQVEHFVILTNHSRALELSTHGLKTPGEAYNLIVAFDIIRTFNHDNVSRIFKITGRAELTDDFHIEEYDDQKLKDKYVFKSRNKR